MHRAFGIAQTNLKKYPVRDSCQLPGDVAKALAAAPEERPREKRYLAVQLVAPPDMPKPPADPARRGLRACTRARSPARRVNGAKGGRPKKKVSQELLI
mgnify:CR=1 FL=1